MLSIQWILHSVLPVHLSSKLVCSVTGVCGNHDYDTGPTVVASCGVPIVDAGRRGTHLYFGFSTVSDNCNIHIANCIQETLV